MPAVDALQRGLGKANDALAAQFLPGITITLCKVSDTTDTFDDLLTIYGKRFWEYSNFRKNFRLEIADDHTDLTEAIGDATHISISDADSTTYYVIIANDTLKPSGTNPVWTLFADLFERPGHYTTL